MIEMDSFRKFRNGNYSRTFKTEYGELNLTIPRDRNGELSQQTLPAYKRTNDSLETTIIQLFQKALLWLKSPN